MTVSLGRRTTAWASAAPARDPGPEHPRRLSLTLAGYLARHVLAGIGLALAALAVVALVIDLVELLRRAHDKPRATFAVVLQLAALHLPFLLQKLAPFAVLFGTILSFQRLGRTGELVVTRGTGATPWQILGPALLVALALGGVAVVALNPLAAALVARYERLERAHFSAPADAPIAVGANGLWLRRVDSAGERLVHARRVSEDATELYDVVAFQFDPGGRFVDRTDAARAHLRAGVWELQDALTTAADGQSARTPRLALATELTAAQIRDNFAPPEALSFWDLPGFIRQLKALGVAAREHELYWHGLLTLPALFCAMVLIGASCTLPVVGRAGPGLRLAVGIGAGFAVHVAAQVVAAIGVSGRLPVLLAAWVPVAVALLLGGTTLLCLEER